MEGDKTADSDKELTSTSCSATSKLLSTNKEEKTDSNDTLPTSSTDASTSTKSTHLDIRLDVLQRPFGFMHDQQSINNISENPVTVSDDPISSTSSEMDPSKPKTNDSSSTDVVDKASTAFDTDAELLGMAITTQPNEKIEENVDDLVNDLETLLGESTDSFTMSSKSGETNDEKTEVTSAIHEDLANLLEDKPEDEVSSNTDATVDKIDTVAGVTDNVGKNVETDLSDKLQENDVDAVLTDKIDTLIETAKTLVPDKFDNNVESSLSDKPQETEVTAELEQTNKVNEDIANITDLTESAIDRIVAGKDNKAEDNVSDAVEESESIVESEQDTANEKFKNLTGPSEASNDVVPELISESKNDSSEVFKNEESSLQYCSGNDDSDESRKHVEVKDKSVKSEENLENLENNVQQQTADKVTKDVEKEAAEKNDNLPCDFENVSTEQQDQGKQDQKSENDSIIDGQSDPSKGTEVKENKDVLPDEKSANENIKSVSKEVVTDTQVQETGDDVRVDSQDIEVPEVNADNSDDTAVMKESGTSLVLNVNENTEKDEDLSKKVETSAEVEALEVKEVAKDQDDKSVPEEGKVHTVEVAERVEGVEEIGENGTSVDAKSQVSDVIETTEASTEKVDIAEEINKCESEESSEVSNVKKEQSSSENVVEAADADEPMDTSDVSKDVQRIKSSEEDIKTEPVLSGPTHEEPQETEQAAEEIKDVKGTKDTAAVDSPEQFKQSEDNNSKDQSSDETTEVESQKTPCADSEHLKEDSTAVKVTTEEHTEEIKEEASQDDALPEESEDQPEVSEKEESWKQDEDVTQTAGDANTSQNEPKNQEDPPKQLIEEIEITELSEAVPVTEDVEVIQADPVIEEPEEAAPLSEEVESVIIDNIEEVNSEEKHLEKLEDEPTISAADEIQNGDVEMVKTDIVDKDVDEDLPVEEADKKTCEDASGTDENQTEHLALANADIVDEDVNKKAKDLLSKQDDNQKCDDDRSEKLAEVIEPVKEKITTPIIDVQGSVPAADSKVDVTTESEDPEGDNQKCDDDRSEKLVEVIEPVKEKITTPIIDVQGSVPAADSKVDVTTESEDPENQPIEPEKKEDAFKVTELEEVRADNEKTEYNEGAEEASQEEADKSKINIDIVDELILKSDTEPLQDSPESKDDDTIHDVPEEDKLVLQISENVEQEVSAVASDSDVNKGDINTASKTVAYEEEKIHIKEKQVVPEINIRRKTVEQDLEKVVCLSEESSDSDFSEQVSSLPKATQEVFPFDEESNLIKIADDVEQFPDPGIIPCDENMPGIEDIFSGESQIIPSVTSADSASNLETILAVASLQNESVSEVREERRLSEKEIREMEAIRMAVASITDSSQDTYDSYLVDNSIAIENSIQDISNDAQYLSNEMAKGSDIPETLPEEIVEESTLLPTSCAEDLTEQKYELSPDNDNKTEKDINILAVPEKVYNSSQSNASAIDDSAVKNIEDSEVDEKPTYVDSIEKIESIPSTESSEIIDSIESQTNEEGNESESTDVYKEVSEEAKAQSEIEVSENVQTEDSKKEDIVDQTAEHKAIEESDVHINENVKDNDIKINESKKCEQKPVENDASTADGIKKSDIITDQNDNNDKGDSGNLVNDNSKPVESDLLTKDNIKKKDDIPDKMVDQKPSVSDLSAIEKVNQNDVSTMEEAAKEIVAPTPQEATSKEEVTLVTKKIVEGNEMILSCKEMKNLDNISLVENMKGKELPTFEKVVEEKRKSVSDGPLESSDVSASKKIVEKAKKSMSDSTAVVNVSQSEEVVKEDKKSVSESILKPNRVSTSNEIVGEAKKSLRTVASNDVTASEEVVKKDKTVSEGNETVEQQSLEENNVTVLEEAVEENEVTPSVEQIVEERPLRSRTRRGNKVSEPLSINVEEVDKKEKIYSPKITIKPVKVPDEEVSTTSDADGNKGSLKITITKQSDKMHSILKVYNPEDESETLQNQEEPIPKIRIKPKMQQVEQQHSPKMTTRSSKAYSPTSTRCSSPRVTIKPVTKPAESKAEVLSPLKITFKPVVKPEEANKRHSPKISKELEQKSPSPKITIKPIPKPLELEKEDMPSSTPKVTIKPIKRHLEENDTENDQERSSPKIIIKPVVKPTEQDPEPVTNQTAPKLKIKPIIKKQDDEEPNALAKDQGSPKISIKPIVKPPELEEEEEVKERIVLKINKGNLPTPTKDSKKREHPDDDKAEKVGIKLKFSTTGGHTHIVQEGEESNKRQRKDSGYLSSTAKKDIEEPSNKRSLEEKPPEKNKRLRSTVTPDKLNDDSKDDVKIDETKMGSPIVISEDSRSQNSADCVILNDSQPASPDISKIVDIASRTTHIEASPVLTVGVATPSVTPAPKKRGRPRKVPLELREELRDTPTTPQVTPQTTLQSTPVSEVVSSPVSDVGTPEATPSPGGRPKRSCRGQNVMATLGIKPRKPRGRGRGSKVNMGDREPQVVQAPVEPVQTTPMKPEKETKLSKAKLRLMQKSADEETQKEIESKQDTEKTDQQREGAAKQKEEKKEKEQKSQKGLEAQKNIESEKNKALKEEKALEEKKECGEAKQSKPEDSDKPNKQNEDAVKKKKDEGEEQTSPKKKKEDKTPPRKLEVTTRRQKAQLQKEAEQAEKTPAETLKVEAKKAAGKSPVKVAVPATPESDPNTNPSTSKKTQPDTISVGANPTTSAATVAEIVVISTDEDSYGKEDPNPKPEEVKEKSTEPKDKNFPENKPKPKNSPPKRAAEKSEEKLVEEKKAKVEVAQVEPEEGEANPIEKKTDQNPEAEVAKKEREKEAAVEEDKKEEVVSAEEEVDSGEDSEVERRREWVLQKKQEAIKKCRAKRMEKLARAAELKKKRQEQAAQQREARKAAEEAERAATEKVRATKRYGRYGVPKPQISLIDEPVQETAGTIKSHMGLFNPETERINITQPIHIDDDNTFDKERSGPLKHLEGHLTPLKSSPQKLLGPESMAIDSADDTPTKVRRSIGTEDVVMLDEETRMSADFRGSRAQTPAKHSIPPPDIMVEDSQGSIGTEGGKSRSSKAPKMEVFQDLESTIITAEQLAEYSWNGQGPFMLQEQVAQYLGIKSFKRKYPNITRRPVDMRERDYLKENCLATEAQCDLGLTAVIAQDILDIMYTDFQDKYEDYCRSQREKQARELANKQKALSQFTLKPGFDKLDILEQAVQSAAAWNQQFNKARREQRKAHMDLQNLTVHYPKSKMKVVPTPKIGHYPVALVPGQFTDHFKEFTPTELNNLPLNTMCYDEIKIAGMETDSEDSSSGSDSDSESTSGSSSSDSCCDDEDCKECVKNGKPDTNGVRETDSDDVVIIENDASSSDSVVLVSVTTAAPVTA